MNELSKILKKEASLSAPLLRVLLEDISDRYTFLRKKIIDENSSQKSLKM